MRIFQILIAAVVLSLAGSAQAVVKFYSSDPGNGEPGNTTRISINLCPPFISSPDTIGGYQKLTDDELGSVELSEFVLDAGISGTTDLSGDILVPIFGPGAFIFIFNNATTSISAPHVSGAGGGPGVTASTAPTTGSIAWGVVSGFTITGVRFCLASPTTICSENGFSHGMTVPGVLPSTTYNLGTWVFTSVGDLEATQQYITRTSNGGLSNNGNIIQGALHGSAIPALPLVGFGALALSLAAIGGRALLGKK